MFVSGGYPLPLHAHKPRPLHTQQCCIRTDSCHKQLPVPLLLLLLLPNLSLLLLLLLNLFLLLLLLLLVLPKLSLLKLSLSHQVTSSHSLNARSKLFLK